MDDNQLLRYSRHLLLDDLGVEGQRRLLASHALVIGAGGLGSPVSLYLGSAGVGRLTLVDDDAVDLTNLQRQIAHRTDSVGRSKVDSAAEAVRSLNPDVHVHPLRERLSGNRLLALVGEADVVIDCTDNYATRQAVNAACWQHGRPLVSGAAIGFDGQLAVYDPRDPSSPCYACVFPPDAPVEEARCATMGVFAPLVGVIGSLQAVEALKLLTGAGDTLAGRLLMFDARRSEWTRIRCQRRSGCHVCGGLG